MFATEPVERLPKLQHPWEFVHYRAMIVACNPNHHAMIWTEGAKEWIPLLPIGQPVFVDVHINWMFHA